MKDYFRRRNLVLIGGSLLVISLLFLTDPDNGSLTLAYLQQLSTPVIAVWFAFLARKALFDYLDVEDVFKKAMETATGAGYVFLGICLVFFGLLGLFGNSARAQSVDTFIPEKAVTYLPMLRVEQEKFWADHPKDICLRDLSSTSLV